MYLPFNFTVPLEYFYLLKYHDKDIKHILKLGKIFSKFNSL